MANNNPNGWNQHKKKPQPPKKLCVCGHTKEEHVALNKKDSAYCAVVGCQCHYYQPLQP